jgi:3'-phosphoadenosine 5'-phosphosulfate sulfotransferase (PAPS reductase)/FAD synthetase
MNNSYFLKDPSVISFSGGRTSGFMLAKVLEAHEGKLPDYVKVVFCNTGLEHPKTLDFVQRCAEEWNIDIVWLEYVGKKVNPRFKVTNYKDAARNGEPFGILIDERQYLPNPVARFCTVELKIKLLDRYMKEAHGTTFKSHNQLIGLRYDEPRRVANIKKNFSRKNPALTPINDAKHTLPDVMSFWSKQAFDLGIPPHQGNCQGCFLKSRYRLDLVAKETPEAFDWWQGQEKKMLGVEESKQHTFRTDRPSYSNMMKQSRMQLPLFPDFDDTVSCHCTD